MSVQAASGSAYDIQEAITEISGIGTVQIPTGTFDFVDVGDWQTVNVPAGVNINGAGATLKTPWDVPGDPYGTWGPVSPVPVWFNLIGAGQANKPSRISNLNCVGYRSIDPNSHSQVTGINIKDVINYRVDHCNFEHITNGHNAMGVNCCGVFDHCRLVNPVGHVEANIALCDVGYGVSFFRGFEDLWEPDIYNVVGKYTNYSHFVEDCYFELWRHSGAANDGAHYVVRHSEFNKCPAFGEIDAHGTYNVVGTRAIEVYNNTFHNALGGYNMAAVFWRGGGGTFFNNTLDESYRYVILVDEGAVQKCFPHDIYVWNNNIAPMVTVPAGRAQEGVDFFQYEMPNYTPYTYPHPLVTGESYVPLPPAMLQPVVTNGTLAWQTDFKTAVFGYGGYQFEESSVGGMHNTIVGLENGGSKAWLEEFSDGQKALALEHTTTATDRAAWAIWGRGSVGGWKNWVGTEFLMEYLMYLPPDFALTSPTDKWAAINEVMDATTFQPKWQLMLLGAQANRPEIPAGSYAIGIDYRSPTEYKYLASKTPYTPPAGKWTKVSWYQKLDPVHGVIKVWLDNVLLFDLKDIDTSLLPSNTDNSFGLSPAKVYHGGDDTLPKQVYTTNVRLYDTPNAKFIEDTPPPNMLPYILLIAGAGALFYFGARKI